MFERCTDRARRIIVLSQQQSVDLGHEQIDVGHLVLAALAEDADELDAVGNPVDLGPVRDAVREHLGPRQRNRGPMGHIPFTTNLKNALDQAQRAALLDHRNYIDDYDLLLAALREFTLATALGVAGIDREILQSAVLTAQRHRPSEEGAAGTGPAESGKRAEGVTAGQGRGRPRLFAAAPPPVDRSGEIVDLLSQVLSRLDTIIERMDNER
ncbi:MAG: Clp protease N-terminal domain-containing protein [Nakamurella sp.]